MKKYNFIENDMDAPAAKDSNFNSALSRGYNFVMRNKGKFIGGGAILGLVQQAWSHKDAIVAGYTNPNNAWQTAIQYYGEGANETLWMSIKRYYFNLFSGSGGVAGDSVNKAAGWFDKIKEAFTKVFSKEFMSAGATNHGIVWGIVAVILLLLGWIAYKIIKKIRSRKQMAATTESYVSLLSDQSFLEAKQVAYYLKENTAMSKKECNKVANYVYKSSLNRKLNNLI